VSSKVVVVAHPDDEVLWAGGYLIRNPGTHVICCSVPEKEPIRAWKFFDACEVLGAIPRLLPATETRHGLRFLDLLDLSRYNEIVTHNRYGEYGHVHHSQVHHYIVDTYKDKTIKVFGYYPGHEGRIKIELSEEESEKKLDALKCYNHNSALLGIPKWQELWKRWIEDKEVPFKIESLDYATVSE